MKQLKTLILFIACLAFTVFASSQIPQLKNNGKTTQLIVHGKPFLMLAGEANNSSGSNIAHMEKTMKDLRESNLNSLLVSVSWEIVEPQEGIFDFSSVDELIRVARENDMKLCILWFASWKNGFSPYAPMWVLNDTKRFVRVKDQKGQNTRTLTPLCNATRDADAKAYTALMKHISSVDSEKNTILVMQIENEVGVLRQTRDFSDEA
ncbi:MAG: beta-galactosidase, partial [Bacteroidetes bacterium]|nr:beta-galactosidase [Bacteroidota bacterium]